MHFLSLIQSILAGIKWFLSNAHQHNGLHKVAVETATWVSWLPLWWREKRREGWTVAAVKTIMGMALFCLQNNCSSDKVQAKGVVGISLWGERSNMSSFVSPRRSRHSHFDKLHKFHTVWRWTCFVFYVMNIQPHLSLFVCSVCVCVLFCFWSIYDFRKIMLPNNEAWRVSYDPCDWKALYLPLYLDKGLLLNYLFPTNTAVKYPFDVVYDPR